jgi:hypothetical protein
MEKSDRLIAALARYDGAPRGAIPCNLLVDPQGRIRGRQIGGEQLKNAQGKRYSIWTTKDALAFVQALAKGALA